jgi:hypothetical protein
MKAVHKEFIETCMRSHMSYRDSNGLLVADVYLNYLDHLLEGVPEATKQAIRVFLYEADKVISLEAITRAKRKLQEIHPELRGESYGRRKRKAKQVAEGINTENYHEVL